ncbi:uncharacterized protein LOC124357527 [Homalodisca vitripennis]|nr:uncharacterized protein LOC124357527 [Homalodisca vitripennis]
MTPCWLLVLLCSPLWHPEGVKGWGGLSTVPSESECRPYIEKALKELTPETPQEAVDATGSEQTTSTSQTADQEGSIEEIEEVTTKESIEGEIGTEDEQAKEAESSEAEGSIESQNAEEVSEEEGTTESKETPQSDELIEDIKSIGTQESAPNDSTEDEQKTEESTETEDVKEDGGEQSSIEEGNESQETNENVETTGSTEDALTAENKSAETPEDSTNEEENVEEDTKSEEATESAEQKGEQQTEETLDESKPEETSEEDHLTKGESEEEKPEETQDTTEESPEKSETAEEPLASTEDHTAEESSEIPGGEVTDSVETTESLENTDSTEAELGEKSTETEGKSVETTEVSREETVQTSEEGATEASAEEEKEISVEETKETSVEETKETSVEETKETSVEETTENSAEETTHTPEQESAEASANVEETVSTESPDVSSEATTESKEGSEETITEPTDENVSTTDPHLVIEKEAMPATEEDGESAEKPLIEPTENVTEQEPSVEEEIKEQEPTDEDQLTLEFEAPKIRRPREHIGEILHLTPESAETEMLLAKTIETTLKDLKKLYDNAINPLEILYKYRDLSNRHFGDPEIFSKPLILFMGPWSGGKSTILNYLLDNEFKSSSLRTGAEPSPAYFNILMWGDREEVLDGTQLAADWTFSGLQKFGQGLLDRLRGLRLNAPLLEKVNIVEIPGILEIRKQVERLFPFNDACQWFIDRADIIFLVYDPSKLDVGPETEAILDQLKGREYQTRIILNKADQVKPEELMRVQGTLIWNISPLMSSQEPPVMYSTSLWSIPYEQGAPSRLLHAQERAFLRDLRQAIDKRVENKIASARRFAVRVRNHAKMVDCYLTTYYNHKTFFGNRKKVADDIIEHPQNYHIYEGLSTLTNISRYDLPDPEVYRDFFRLNPVYDFQRLSDTCTYFRGCPINRLDVAIAYDLPELVGKYKKQAERVLEAAAKS